MTSGSILYTCKIITFFVPITFPHKISSSMANVCSAGLTFSIIGALSQLLFSLSRSKTFQGQSTKISKTGFFSIFIPLQLIYTLFLLRRTPIYLRSFIIVLEIFYLHVKYSAGLLVFFYIYNLSTFRLLVYWNLTVVGHRLKNIFKTISTSTAEEASIKVKGPQENDK